MSGIFKAPVPPHFPAQLQTRTPIACFDHDAEETAMVQVQAHTFNS